MYTLHSTEDVHKVKHILCVQSVHRVIMFYEQMSLASQLSFIIAFQSVFSALIQPEP